MAQNVGMLDQTGLRGVVSARFTEMERADGLKRTQAWLATRLRMDPSTLNRYLNGSRTPPPDFLYDLSLVLGVPEDLLRPADASAARSVS